jgi:hypothetical protein
VTIMDSEMDTAAEQWTPDGPQGWALQTSDGYLGHAHWRKNGAVITVTRPDGSDLLRRTWGSREIFVDAWPGVFEWLKGRVTEQIAAARSQATEPTQTTDLT